MSDASAALSRMARARRVLSQLDARHREGRVVSLVGTIVLGAGVRAAVGATCSILTQQGEVRAEVVGFHADGLQLLPLAQTRGIAAGDRIRVCQGHARVPVGSELLGRVVDAFGDPLDDGGPIACSAWRALDPDPPPPMARPRISQPLESGVRALDAMVTIARGQRLGLFAGSGVGKSTLLGMLARRSDADINVLALIGERGREVREFLERDLGPEGAARSVVVVATSDQPAPVRIRAAMYATSIAEFYRDRGMTVCLMMDSLTRIALAQREIGLAIGEPPATRGYTPSVFALIPRLLERSGMAAKGSITGLYTVLVEGDDMMEPVADLARSILDGHVVLTRRLAERGHYPAIDVLASVSRLMTEVVTPRHRALAQRARAFLAALESARDLLDIGAYVAGTNPTLDQALAVEAALTAFLRQDAQESERLDACLARLEASLQT